MERIKCVKKSDANFPELLRSIQNPPAELFYRGADLGQSPAIAIVGTRRASPEGREAAREFARALAGRGFEIISGLALGIDGAAHVGALEAGGVTRAVLASGPDSIYPPGHEGLARKILNMGGTVLAEYPPGTPSYPSQFLERNRIVSGLALATIVIEAPAASGALVTARCAAEEGREVYVLPGPARRANFAGSHALIRKGARLVSSVGDALEDLMTLTDQYPALREMLRARTERKTATQIEDEEQRAVFEAIAGLPDSPDIDKISELTKLPTHAVSRSLTFLTLAGLVKESGDRYIIAN